MISSCATSVIQGGDVALQARTDINNRGGTLAGDHSLLALAGGDINATTTTRSAQRGGWWQRQLRRRQRLGEPQPR